jgi:hypothetical protein
MPTALGCVSVPPPVRGRASLSARAAVQFPTVAPFEAVSAPPTAAPEKIVTAVAHTSDPRPKPAPRAAVVKPSNEPVAAQPKPVAAPPEADAPEADAPEADAPEADHHEVDGEQEGDDHRGHEGDGEKHGNDHERGDWQGLTWLRDLLGNS